MMDIVDSIAALIHLNGGEIVGRTRLQKIGYLLEAKGLGFDIDYDYHNYGPYSAELAFAADDARSLGYIETDERYGYHEVPYTIFRSTATAPTFEDAEFAEKRQKALEVMSDYSALVLELAATAVFLTQNGYPEDFWAEVKRRKSLKASPERIEQAKKMIVELGL